MLNEELKNDEKDLQNTTDICTIPNLPKYCDFFKFYLIEELVLEENYDELHYGKCQVIGKLRESAEGDFYLENIKLPNLPSEYSLPEGTVELRIIRFNYFGTELRHGRCCEACGELVLLDLSTPANNRIPFTSRGVREQLHHLVVEKKTTKEAYLKQLNKTHKPALKLLLLNEIAQAGELAERNLQIRMLCQEGS